jgi:WD40 repeat protein
MTTQQLRPQVKMNVSPGKAITSLRYKGWYHTKDQSPELIANCQDGTLKLFSIVKVTPSSSQQGGGGSGVNIKYKKSFPCQNKGLPIRSCFCPLISVRDGACVVTGSSDNSIYIYDVKREGEGACVNQFMGHSCAVLDVSWNYEESLLASCDSAGDTAFLLYSFFSSLCHHHSILASVFSLTLVSFLFCFRYRHSLETNSY